MKKVIILIFCLVLFTGCTTNKIKKKDEKVKEKKVEEVKEIYKDENDMPISFYENNKKITTKNVAFKVGQDLGVFQVFPSTEDNIEKWSDFYNEWNKYDSSNKTKIGYNISYTLKDGKNISHTIVDPSNTMDYEGYIAVFLYDDYNNRDKSWYSHVEEKDYNDNTFGKDNSIKRFINNFNKLPNYLKEVIVIENDDKVFNIIDCINISKQINCPIVFDYHHYKCNNNGERIEDFFPIVLKSWQNKTPKIHFSSSKSNLKKEFRSHNDYIDSNNFIDFLNKISIYNTDIDIMIEAKQTDDAMFKLLREIKYKTNYTFLDETTFIV